MQEKPFLTVFRKNNNTLTGVEAGRESSKIHSIPITEVREDWEVFFNRKIDDKISKYKECPVQYEKWSDLY